MELLYPEIEAFLSEDEIKQSCLASKKILDNAKIGEQRYCHSTGWLNPEKWANKQVLARIEEKAGEIRQQADAFVLIGVGGSNNAARGVIKALKTTNAPKIIYMSNTLSAHALSEALKQLDGKNFYINCIAKNFETLEPGVSFRFLRQILQQKHGPNAYKKIIVTGTGGSHLEKLSHDHGYDFFPFPDDIGGRFTALSAVGLLPR